CHILNAYPNVLALHEPLTPSDFNPALGRAEAVTQIECFAQQSRVSALRDGVVVSRQKDGRVPENPVAQAAVEGGLRPMDVSLGQIDVRHQLQDEHFTLVIKHNALFTALLPELNSALPVYGIVRNPLAVLASWNQVDLPVNQGHIPAGEMFDSALKAKLAQISDRMQRQLHILEWFCRQYADHLAGRILRYEDFVINPHSVGDLLQLPSCYQTGDKQRSSRNAGYDLAQMEVFYKQLRGYGDALRYFYPPAQLDELMDSIRASA
ncbi:MAG TPA: hypothetical protein DIW64_13980, partial [Cellvibrio sp.]|nr:hypothetical protein [Cellvibrio sp.]